jgi:RNA polymerase sigma-70 factor (ECF subfamily)
MAQLSGTFPRLAAITPRMRDAASASDVDLMRRTAAGDRGAFETLYRTHQATVYRFARLMTGSTTIAEDVVQEVFLALMRDASRYDPARASLTTYLYGSARHHTRRRLLRDRLLVRLDDQADLCLSSSSATVADELIRQRDVQHLRRAIVRLPARYREVIVLCDLQDVSYADAAQALGCAIGTVRSRLHRARHLLADKLQRGLACADMARRPALRCEV